MSQLVHAFWVRVLCGLAAAFAFAPASLAQDYPVKPVRMIVAFPAGSGIDASARFFAARLAPGLGQQVFVENRPGAAGVIGTETAARAAPDGYTLYMGAVTNIALTPNLYAKPPYNVERDFVAISLIGVSHTGVMVNPGVAAKDAKALAAVAKSEPLTAATVGVGTNLHLYAEWFRMLTGAQFRYIAYNTTSPLSDLIAGHVQVVFDGVAPYLGNIRAGKLKLLAITGKARHPALPDVPTFAELGLAEFEPLAYGGLFAPAGTPSAIVEKIGAAAARAAKTPEMIERYRNAAGESVGSTPAEFAAFVKSELAKWAKVTKAAGVRLD